MLKRLQDRCQGRVLGQILYLMQGGATAARDRIAVGLTHLVTKETPGGANLQTMFREKKGLDLLLPLITVPPTDTARTELQRQAALGLNKMADALGLNEPRSLDDIAPPEPKVFLGSQVGVGGWLGGWGQRTWRGRG